MQKISLPDFADGDCAFKATLVCSGRGYGKLMSCRLGPGYEHEFKHEIYFQTLCFLSGNGKLREGKHMMPVVTGDIVFIKQNERYVLVNRSGGGPLTFLWHLHSSEALP